MPSRTGRATRYFRQTVVFKNSSSHLDLPSNYGDRLAHSTNLKPASE
jgi:hypothetical protein